MELKLVARREGRLSSFLRGELKLSSSLMNRLKWGDGLRVNGECARTNHPVKPGDVITVTLDEPVPEYPAEDGKLSVLWEDAWFLAVDKPAGMLIHPSTKRNTGTLANYVVGYYQKTGQKSAFHPITRLDRDTFGVVLLAKNAHAHALMQNGELQKRYHAMTFGGPAEASGIIDAPIARMPLPSLLRTISPEGKPSVTEYQVLEQNGKLWKLALRPITGRTHQLRLHCAYMGWPILGDPQYGSRESQAFSRELGLESQLLCAKEVEFCHPITGENIRIVSQMDAKIM